MELMKQGLKVVERDDLEGKNYIRTKVSDDRKVVTLQMFLANEPGQWIEYDAEQLGELIRLLNEARATLTSSGMQ
jgi:hypothetical protein